MIKYTITAVLLLAGVASATAQTSTWTTHSEGGACWANSIAKETIGNVNGRSVASVSIQNHPSENVRGSIAFINGGLESSEYSAEIDVDGKKFPTLTYKEAAFVGSGKAENDLTTAMQRGKKIDIKWTAKDGNTITDTFDLNGFTAAKNTIDNECR